MLTLIGNDNYGNPKQDFLTEIATLTDSDFVSHARRKIWLSAYASNNPRSDYHWQADACWQEAQRRGKPELYELAHREASAQ